MTGWFQPAASAYQRLALMQWVGRWWWLVALPVAASCVMAFIDIRFVFVALILVFLVVPFVVFNVHFYQLLSPELRCRLYRQRFVISYGTSITIEYEAPQKETDTETDAAEEGCEMVNESIDWNAVERIERNGAYWLIKLTKASGHTPAFILAPCEAVDNDITYPFYYE